MNDTGPKQRSLTETIVSGRGHVATSRDTFDCYNPGKGAIGIWLAEATDVTKHPIVLRTGPHNKELSGLKCQQCREEPDPNVGSYSAN